MDNNYYIVRANNAGVFFGKIRERNDAEVVLTDVRRLWYWDGATDCLDLSKNGVSRPQNCNFTVTVDEVTIFASDLVEIDKCTDKAVANLKGVPVWNA